MAGAEDFDDASGGGLCCSSGLAPKWQGHGLVALALVGLALITEEVMEPHLLGMELWSSSMTHAASIGLVL
jgi:hypothetical protein